VWENIQIGVLGKFCRRLARCVLHTPLLKPEVHLLVIALAVQGSPKTHRVHVCHAVLARTRIAQATSLAMNAWRGRIKTHPDRMSVYSAL
jgi:hypothetical protein